MNGWEHTTTADEEPSARTGRLRPIVHLVYSRALMMANRSARSEGGGAEPARGAETAQGYVLGILGGMGPLASAGLLLSIYELNRDGLEQNAPRCALLSDPSIPDRSSAIHAGDGSELVRRLSASLATLVDLGCDRTVVACMTAHHFFPRLPEVLRHKLISLVDLTINAMTSVTDRTMVLCTTGVRRTQLFEHHARWPEVAERAVFLGDADQQLLHRFLYDDLKCNRVDGATAFVRSLLSKYRTPKVVFACTELHLVTRRWMVERLDERDAVIDPLWLLARDLRNHLGYMSR